MTTELATNTPTATAVEQVLVGGDLSRLNTEQRVSYYNKVCESLGLNPLTRPFEYLTLNGKMQLYARRDCAEQLRHRDNISITIVSREVVEGCYVVTARATTPRGRTDESIGAVAIDGVKGKERANAMMTAETKSKRRCTLSVCGLGILDETEVATISGAIIAAASPIVDAAIVPPAKARVTVVMPEQLPPLPEDVPPVGDVAHPITPATAMASPAQVRKLAIAMKFLGTVSREDRLAWINIQLASKGKAMIISSKELSADDCSSLITRAETASQGCSDVDDGGGE